jgi:protease-4
MELKSSKPVVASFGGAAASGGYYIACGADKIVSMPTTLTGSIGIFGLFPSAQALADKWGAHYDGVGTNKHSTLGTEVLTIPFLNWGLFPARPLDTLEHAMLQTYVERGYDRFVEACATGRGLPKSHIEGVGQGRVWTGAQAQALSLVDTLGTLQTAIEMAAKMANLSEYSVSEYPSPKDPVTLFTERLLGIAEAKFFPQELLGKEFNLFDVRQAIADF